MKTVSKSTLKAKMFEYFRELEKQGGELVVTDNSVPVLKIIPIHPMKDPETVFSKYRGKISYAEDINTPTIKEWVEK